MKKQGDWSVRCRRDPGRPPRWIISYYASGKRRESTLEGQFANQRGAERAAAGVVSGLILEAENAAAQSGGAGVGTTLKERVPAWIALRKARPGLRRATIADNESHLECHIVPAFGEKPLGELDVPTLRAWVRSLRGKLAAFSLRNVLNTLTALLDDAMAEGWVAWGSNPARAHGVRVELPTMKRQGETLYLSREVVTALVACPEVPEWHTVRYLLACLAGLRDGEVQGLRWGDVHIDADVPHLEVREQIAFKGEGGYASPQAPKTEDSERVVPLHPFLAAALAAWREGGWPARAKKAKPAPQDRLFPGLGRVESRPRSAEHLRADLKAAGLADNVRGQKLVFHDLRHSFATWLREAGVDVPTIEKLMGHRGASVTERHYTAAVLRHLAGAVVRVEFPVGNCGQNCGQWPQQKREPRANDGAPETNRTSDQRFRKQPLAAVGNGAECGGGLPGPSPSTADNGLSSDSGTDSAAKGRLAAAWPQLDPVVGIGRILVESYLYDLLAVDDLAEGEGRP